MTHTRSRMLSLRTVAAAAAVLALLVPSTFAYAGAEELEGVRDAIKARGARWHADETSVSRLSAQEKKLRLGMNEHDGLAALFGSPTETAPVPQVTAAPPTLDWRNTDGVAYVSPVKNQGSCGSCWAFAVTAALESQVMIGTAGAPVDLSEQILLSCSGAGTCAGGYASTASNYVRDVGLPPESYFRYTAADTSCSTAAANWQGDTDKVRGWHSPTIATTVVQAMKDSLYAYGPVLATMYVYNDFYSYRSGVYSYTTGSYAGAHAVLVVGYDDVNQCFIVKNSWGSGWGEAGYFQIAYSEVTGTSRFGYSVLVYDGYAGVPPPPDTAAPSVTVTSPASGATISGSTTVSVAASDNVGVASVGLYLDGVLLGTDLSSPFSFAWNTTATVNGVHSLQAVAYDGAGNSGVSAAVGVNVNNVPDTTAPTVTISKPTNGSTVTKVAKIGVSAVDAVRVQRIEAYADGKLLGTTTCSAGTCSATFNWNTGSGVAKGPHTITAYAFDKSSNRGTASVTVYK